MEAPVKILASELQRITISTAFRSTHKGCFYGFRPSAKPKTVYRVLGWHRGAMPGHSLPGKLGDAYNHSAEAAGRGRGGGGTEPERMRSYTVQFLPSLQSTEARENLQLCICCWVRMWSVESCQK